MRLKFDARARAILRRLPVVNAYSVAELALLAALAVQGARLVWTVVTPIAPLGAWAPAGPTAPLDAASVFGAFDPFYRVSGVPAGPSTVTSLQLTLYGIRIDEAQGRGSAIVAGPDGVQQSVSVGEEVSPGVRLKAVAFDHVTLDRGGVAEDLFLDQSSGASAGGGGGEPVMAPPGGPPRTISAVSADPPSITPVSAEQLRADTAVTPRIDGGRVSGLVIRGQGRGAFKNAGLRDGDVVVAIGGSPVQGAGDLERLMGEAVSNNFLHMTVERGGQTVPVNVPVAK